MRMIITLLLLVSCSKEKELPKFKEQHLLMCELSCMDDTTHSEEYRKTFCKFKEGQCFRYRMCGVDSEREIADALGGAISVGVSYHCLYFKR